jgi:hypothetical protein
LLWDDIKECCLEEATTARIANQEEEEQIDVVAGQRAGANDNLIVEQRNRWGAASFFPDSSDKEMEEAAVATSVEDILSDEFKKYQADKGLRLQTEGAYNWLNHSF